MEGGTVVSIHIAPAAESATRSVPSVRAVPGKGLEGDRYYLERGTYSAKKGADREVTLIEIEAIEALARDYGAALEPGESRRNIVTRGLALNHLVGRDFSVGEVRMRGLRLCEPCHHLVELSGKKVLPGLVHRGGLRAQVLSEGIVRAGDLVRDLGPSAVPPARKVEH